MPVTDLTSPSPVPQSDADYEAIFEQHLVEIRFLRERMQQDHADIDRLNAETNVLKADGARLEAESRAILNRLKKSG